MKHLFINSVILSIVLQTSAFAASSTTTAIPASDAKNAATAAATSIAEVAPFKSVIHASYTGSFVGPGLNAEAGKTKDGDDIFVSNRIAVKDDITINIDAGLQARIATAFAKDGLKANNEVWRFFADFKNVATYDILSVNLTARLLLPTSKKAHNNSMTLSPELLASFNINPKNSRFSFAYTPQAQQIIYTNSAVATANNAMSFYLVHNLEATYNLGSTTQITFGYYPEYMSKKQAAFTNSSNEIDLGINWDFAKGWSVNPFIATELNGLNSASMGKNMQANLVLSGSFL